MITESCIDYRAGQEPGNDYRTTKQAGKFLSSANSVLVSDVPIRDRE